MLSDVGSQLVGDLLLKAVTVLVKLFEGVLHGGIDVISHWVKQMWHVDALIFNDCRVVRDLLELSHKAINIVLESATETSLSQISELGLGLQVDTLHACLTTNQVLHGSLD